MHIESVPNRKSHPTILLRESYRADGKVRKRTIANLTHWPEQLVEGLRTLLRGGFGGVYGGLQANDWLGFRGCCRSATTASASRETVSGTQTGGNYDAWRLGGSLKANAFTVTEVEGGGLQPDR